VRVLSVLDDIIVGVCEDFVMCEVFILFDELWC